MKALIDVIPTAEQLALFSRVSPGVEVIRGAAGSGKTTTALLKLRACVGFYLSRARRQVNPKPVRVLVLTYNRTLRATSVSWRSNNCQTRESRWRFPRSTSGHGA